METQPVVVFEKTIGGTTYIVEYAVSDCAKETAYDKVKKLILNDTESYQNVKAS
ncbi:MAG: transposon-encoded TnpW family protein [Solobacterium sp.]|nr:transposon-encoded TnpW family protein [Solobacterium sp.]